MPYTPPAQRSPASTANTSPSLSRNHSYSNPLPASSHAGQPQRATVPRTVSSQSYYQNRQRRSPSISDNDVRSSQNGINRMTDSNTRRNASLNGSLRQSPPPANNLLIPTGAITTPPDSGSDDEERGRRSPGSLRKLHKALADIDIKRGHSPSRGDGTKSAPAGDLTAPPVRPALTPEARKISHSRSSSETTLFAHNPNLSHSPIQMSDDSEEEELRIKPPLLRKKSGELVKPALRPPSRRRPSSMPGTPTFSKAVHFNEDIEQVRHFLQVDKPIAVSAGSSPVETYDSESEYPFGHGHGYPSRVVEWDIRLPNFPLETFERKAQPVRVEKIFLRTDTKTLIGNVAVANIAFEKLVIARFTLDYWKTTSEVVAEYDHDVRKTQANDGYDRFKFTIKLADRAHLENKTLLLCVRYQVNDQTFWDNNNSINYEVDFVKKTKADGAKGGSHTVNAGSFGAGPHGRRSQPTLRKRPSFDDDFSHGFDSKYTFNSPKVLIGDSPSNFIRLKSSAKRNSVYATQDGLKNQAAHHSGLSGRYDFGVSLSAALNNIKSSGGRSVIDAPRTRPGLSLKTTPPPQQQQQQFKPAPSTAPAVGGNDFRPDAIASRKPATDSEEYRTLINQWCYFGKPSPPKQTKPGDGVFDSSESEAGSYSGRSSVSNSPPSPSGDRSHLGDGANELSRVASPPYFQRSASPRTVTGSDMADRTASPVQFGYPFNHNKPSSILTEPHTPHAILG